MIVGEAGTIGSIEGLMGLSLDTQLESLKPLRRQVNIEAASRLRLRRNLQ
jgi:GntR family transcriptional regulator